jgi:serine/threonine-protein kinase
MSLSPGDRFDRYVIEELLGEGGMARVYRAHDPRLSRRVALKVLRVDSNRAPESAADASVRVMREARAAAALDHPNAISVFDVGEADGQLFIAMELVVGKSLRAFVDDASVRWETKLRWMVDAARALGAAHERGLVHRDVKPENIMVRSDGVVKVLDFGIAKRMRVDVAASNTLDEGRSQSTLGGGIVGTPRYLSPEQLRGDVVDGRADQFAWAVTTFELLTGSLPWPKGVDGFQLVLAILNKIPEPPSKLLPALPSIVDATIIKALAKGPKQRFEAMEYVANALEGITSNSRRSWAEVTTAATTKTDPAPPMEELSTLEGLQPSPVPVTNDATTLPTHHARPRTLRRPATLALLVVAAATMLAFAAARLNRPTVAASSAQPAAEPPPSAAPRAVTETPVPRSTVPEALAAYRAFQTSFREADWNAAMRALEKAVERDPMLAAGQLRLAFMRSLESLDEGLVRATFMQAVRHRDGLDDRDAALLDALAPYLQSDPSDPLECSRRLDALHAQWPLDAEIAYLLGSVRYDRGDLAAAVEAFDAALRIDPTFALASSTKGGVLAYMGRFDEARAALDDAVLASRSATEPLWYLAEIDEQQGQCASEEAHVRTWLSRDPDDWYAYQYLAFSLAGQGKSPDAMQTAFEQKWVRLDPQRRPKVEPTDRARLAMLAGDFAAAQRQLDDMEKLLANEPGAQAHADVHVLLTRIAEETGHPERARAIAEAFLARKDAWSPSHRVDNVSIFLDPIPEMIGVLARTGALTPAQRDQRRTDWLDGWRGRTAEAYRGYLWIAGWAMPASTREEGQAALAVLPSFGGVPAFSPNLPALSLTGHAYLLGDRIDDAVTALRKGSASCTQLAEPIQNTHGWFDLGTALESKGDPAGACAAYRVVLERWGKAKPKSLTADGARARAGALGCR